MATSSTTKRLATVVALAAALEAVAPAQAAYRWPLKPFNRQHPVRAYFGDPRIAGYEEALGTFHFGIDISARNGTAVYATLNGVAGRDAVHPDVVVVVSNGRGTTHEYWHVVLVPAGSSHGDVPHDRRARRSALGTRALLREGRRRVREPAPPRSSRAVPRSDEPDHPQHLLRAQRPCHRQAGERPDRHRRRGLGRHANAGPRPWSDKPVSPAFVEWRLTGNRELASSKWQVVADFRYALPTVSFASVYAPWTRQNHPWDRGGRGRYRYELARELDTRGLPNGTYHVVVLARDTAGNQTRSSRTFTVANGV